MKCRKGLHEMTEDNTKLDVKGRKHCRACIRERKSRYHKGSLGVGRHNKTAGNNHEREMAEALEANPPQIVWRRDKQGVMRAVSIDDPHAETGRQRKRDEEFCEAMDTYFAPAPSPQPIEPECTDETLLAAGTRDI